MSGPLYRQVYNVLQERMGSQFYPRKSALPSELKLADEFGVSLITVRRAIHELVLDGLVDNHQGKGNFVRDPAQGVVVVAMSSFTRDVASGRLRLVRTLMEDKVVRASDQVAGKLRVQPGSMLRLLVRLDCEGGVPLSVDEAYTPPAFASGITPEMAASPLFLKLWQESVHIGLSRIDYEIHVEAASDRDRIAMEIAQDVPILVTGELISDPSGRPVTWIVTRYRGDRCRLSGGAVLVQNDNEHS